MMHPSDAGVTASVHLPWATEPSALGSNECAWCGRSIYLPAAPCSTLPVAGLERMKTMPGQGMRCQYELSTRAPKILQEAGIAPVE